MSHDFSTLLRDFQGHLEPALLEWLRERRKRTAAYAGRAVELTDCLEDLISAGGKRLRPALVHFGFLAAGGEDTHRALPLAMATELLHTYLLIHDDIMDHAETRRGLPAAHGRFRDAHQASGWRGDSADYGVSMAILAGDLAHSFALDLFHSTQAPAAHSEALRTAFFTMCQEVIDGQFLEMHQGLERDPTASDLEGVLRLKSGLYSVERPLQLGAILAGAEGDLLDSLSTYGRATGEAFQLQDDLLGIFGDASATGKPVGGDLREGKFTFLIHFALQATGTKDRRRLRNALGDKDAPEAEVAAVCELIRGSGAEDRVRQMISERSDTARKALEGLDIDPVGRTFLSGLIDYLTQRRS